MRFPVRLKIFAAMGVALALLIGLGADGLVGVNATYRLVQDIYQSNVQAMVSVANTERGVVDMRLALNRALIDPSIRNTDARVRADLAKEAAAWKTYYPVQVTSDDERTTANRYMQLRATALPLVMQEVALLDAGKTEQAKQLHLTQVSGALGDMAKEIDVLVDVNARQASEAANAAAVSHAHTRNVAIAVMIASIIVLLVIAALIVRAVVRPLAQARALAQAIQAGRLNNETKITGNDEFTDTLTALGDMDRRLAEIVLDVREISEQVSSSAADIAQGNDDLSQRTQEQASSLEETAASMEQLAATVTQNAEGAGQAKAMSEKLRNDADAGSKVSNQASEAMAAITQSSQEIGEIVSLIDGIAFQTNLLALNAAVEAARAGEQGRGFAVVATEVRTLAQRSAAAAKEIKQLVSSTVERVELGERLVTQTGAALDAIGQGSRSVHAIVAEIAAASQEQSAGIHQVNQAVLTLDDVTQQNAALVEEASAASKNTADLSEELRRRMAFFCIPESPGTGTAPPTSSASEPSPVVRREVTAPLPLMRSSVKLAAEADSEGMWREF
ncbi:methyl-accepting chemotaxis protein [Luteibacter yeojuensis]|uniref:methyl-accepting chemotaxis protein n=1 Tax=Luteibacter yeojuensis TaxID=345309 RepID=UPI000A0112D8|nr:methyl-accepting chemotaxis protein [Luteibacter yeojuensis]